MNWFFGPKAPKGVPRTLLGGSILLFLASLTQNAFCLGDGAKCDNLGLAVLGLGWMEMLAIGDVGPFVTLPWFANPCLLIAWISILDSRRRVATAVAGVAAVLGSSFLAGRSIQISEGGPTPDPIRSYGAGYWLWLGSLVLAFLSAVLIRTAGTPQPPPSPLPEARP